MPSNTPCVEPVTAELAYAQILAEAIPLGKLIGFIVGVSLVPFGLMFLLSGGSRLGLVFALFGQFILAVGAGLVLMYVIARASALSGEGSSEDI